MIYITQLIYLREGKEELFHEFEDLVIPIIPKYNGRLLLRVRPGETSIVERNIDKPYEIHFVEFDSEQDFRNYSEDEERKRLLHLKEKSVRSILLVRGEKL